MAAIFREYDRAALDAQYNNRARVPDHAEIMGRWTTASEAARDRLDGRLDIAYGAGPRDRLDIFPAATGPAPVLAFIHGGYWQMLDKGVFSWLAEPFVAAGITYAAIGYPLAPDAGLDDICESVRRALEWLSGNAADHGGDPGRIHVAGHSAGGHLTAIALTTDDWAARGAAPAGLVKSGCAISGLYDLEPIRLTYLNEALGMDEAVARRNSPVHNLASAAGHLIAAVGGDESEEFRRQQADFVREWEKTGQPCEVASCPGRNHFTVLDDLAAPQSALHNTVKRQILQ